MAGGQRAGVTPGVHDIGADPLFADVELHLDPASPCIDAADDAPAPDDDLENVPRPQDGDGDAIAISHRHLSSPGWPGLQMRSTPDGIHQDGLLPRGR